MIVCYPIWNLDTTINESRDSNKMFTSDLPELTEVPITFDEILEQCPSKSLDDMRTENKDYFLQLILENIKLGFRLIQVPDVFNNLPEQIWVDAKRVYEEIFDEFYKHHTLDQMKILYARFSSPLLRRYDQTFLQLLSNYRDYSKYGIAHYDNPWEEFPDSRVLGSIRKTLDGFSYLFATDYCFTDTEKTKIFHHITHKFYSDLREKHPQSVVIINDFINKHESIYMSSAYVSLQSSERIEAITKEKIQNRLDEISRRPVTMYMEINGVRLYEGTVNPGEVVRLGDGIAFSAGSAELSDK